MMQDKFDFSTLPKQNNLEGRFNVEIDTNNDRLIFTDTNPNSYLLNNYITSTYRLTSDEPLFRFN